MGQVVSRSRKRAIDWKNRLENLETKPQMTGILVQHSRGGIITKYRKEQLSINGFGTIGFLSRKKEIRFLLHIPSKVIPRTIKDTNVIHRPLNLLTESICYVLILCLYVLVGSEEFFDKIHHEEEL